MFLFLVLQLVLVLIAFVFANAGRPEGLVITGLLAIPLYGVMAIYEIKRERFFLSPLSVYLLMSIAYAGLAPLWVGACLILEYRRLFWVGYVPVASRMPLTQVVVLLGVASYYLGCKLLQRSRWYQVRGQVKKTKQDASLNATFWIMVIGIATFPYFDKDAMTAMKSIGTISSYFLSIPMFGIFLVLTCRAGFEKGQFKIYPAGPRIFVAFGVVALVLSSAMKSGLRFMFLYIIILFLWGYVLQREQWIRSQFTLKRIRGFILPGILFLAALFLISTVIMPFGKRIAQGKGFKPTREQIFSNIYNLRDTFPTKGIWEMPFRFAGTSMLAIGACIQLRDMRFTPDHKVIPLFFIGLIPRVFWPEKPYISQGAKFSALLHIGRGRTEETATSCTKTTAIGELYWSYGVIGVILGMVLIGVCYTVLYQIFSPKFALNPVRAWVTAWVVVNTFQWLENEATTAFVEAVFMCVVVYPLSWINLSWMRSKVPLSPTSSPNPQKMPLSAIPGANRSAAVLPPPRLDK